MPKKNDFLCISCILAVFYMYICTLCEAFQIHTNIFSVLKNRAPLLSIIIIIGLITIFAKHLVKYNQIITSGFALTAYMVILSIGNQSMDFFSWISCCVMWIFVILIFYNISDGNIEEKYINILTLLSGGLALLYIWGTTFKIAVPTVVSRNSMYYVLCSVPFSLRCKNKYIKLAVLIAISIAALISTKTTCLIAMILIWGGYIWDEIRHGNIIKLSRVVLIISTLIVFFFGWSIVKSYTTYGSIGLVLEASLEEVYEGGSGRTDIYNLTWSGFLNSNILQEIIGHGFGAVDRELHSGTHNDFLMVLYNYGIIGFILYLGFWVTLIKECYFQVMEKKDETVSYIGSFIIFFVMSMASNVLNTQIQFLLLCIFWGLFSTRNKQNVSTNVTWNNT